MWTWSLKEQQLDCFTTSTHTRTKDLLLLTCVHGKGTNVCFMCYLHICVGCRQLIISFLQFWVCLQLPLVGQPESQLGWSEESGHDGTPAGGAQIRHPLGCPQGELPVLIGETSVPNEGLWSFTSPFALWMRRRRSRGRTWWVCRTPQPQLRCMPTGRSGLSLRCCSLDLAKVPAHVY